MSVVRLSPKERLTCRQSFGEAALVRTGPPETYWALDLLARHFPTTFACVVYSSLHANEQYEPERTLLAGSCRAGAAARVLCRVNGTRSWRLVWDIAILFIAATYTYKTSTVSLMCDFNLHHKLVEVFEDSDEAVIKLHITGNMNQMIAAILIAKYPTNLLLEL